MTWWTTAVRPPIFHRARPLASWPMMLRFGIGEPEVAGGGIELVGRLAEDDLGGGVGEEPGGDLGGRGAVVGLGDEVGRAVGDAEVGGAVGAAELEAGLQVGGGVPVAEQRPGLVEHLDPLRSGAGHELLEPPGGGDHDEGQRVGVERDGGEVEDDAGPVPPQGDGGWSVEHASQGSGEELVDGVGDGAGLDRELTGFTAEPGGDVAGGVGDEVRDVDEGGLGDLLGAGEVLDRGEHGGVLELGEGAFEDGGDERGAHLGSAEDLLVGGFVGGGGSGGERVDAGGAAGAEADGGEPEVLGEAGVLALGVGDGDPPTPVAVAVDGGLAPQQALHEGGLAVAGFAEDPGVGVGDEPGGVGLERVPAELAASGERGRSRRRCLGGRRRTGRRTGRCWRRARSCPGAGGAGGRGGS